MVDWESFYSSFRSPGFVPGFEIQNRLGGGAFGEVYKARKQSIGKTYAIKFLKLDGSTESEVIERELEQVRLFASIDHPNLVTIEDMGVALGVPFVIMGYAGEDTLSRRMKRRELDTPQAVRFFVQACRGVLALHDRRLAHFDLKPSNIFIKGDVARVGDYGLAKLLTDGRQTLSFGRGTPHYMAPEMLKNRGDHRADIYSLGIILYECLTARLPFPCDEDGFGNLMRESDDPPEFPESFPLELRPVVERALRLEPDHRYWSVKDLLAELGQTSRQGDSVRLGPLGGEPGASPDPPGGPGTAGVPGATGADAPTPMPEGPTPTDAIRMTAAELARGAVEVARGVWDGVRTSSTDAFGRRRSEGPETPEPPAGDGEGDVVSFKTLDEPDDPAQPADNDTLAAVALVRQGGGPTGGREGSKTRPPEGSDEERAELAVAGRWSPLRDDPPSRAGGVVAPSAAGADAGEPGSEGRVVMASAIPVPPRAEGGPVGALAATLVLGFETMVALVSGPVLTVMRGLGHQLDRLARGLPGLLGSTVKAVLIFLLFLMLGALGMALLLLFTRAFG